MEILCPYKKIKPLSKKRFHAEIKCEAEFEEKSRIGHLEKTRRRVPYSARRFLSRPPKNFILAKKTKRKGLIFFGVGLNVLAKMGNYIGIDIGGTKSAVVLARVSGDEICMLERVAFATADCASTIDKFFFSIGEILKKRNLGASDIEAVGISSGGPLDSQRGVIMSPPNLIGWDDVHITKIFRQRLGVESYLQNDANACALAEWKFGAGRGARNMVFMTFGTGLGAGLIINGRLYSGSNGNAGEVGHIRLERFGPVGYGKKGSFEGFCSGSGIAQLAKLKAAELFQSGTSCAYCRNIDDIDKISAKTVAEAANLGDETAKEVYRISGEYLGRGLSIVIDLLNPEVIVIGSIFARSEALLRPSMEAAIKREALVQSARVCKIVPAKLGEDIGDYAALSVAVNGALK